MKARMITAVLLLLAAGFGWFLPAAVTAISDRNQEGKVETLELEPISLQYHDTLEKLGWFETVYGMSLRLPIHTGQLLKSAEAIQIAKDFVQQAGLCERVSVDTIRTEFQNVSISGRGHSLILWEVRLILNGNDNRDANIIIDDASGLILGFSVHVGHTDYDTTAVLEAYSTHLLAIVGEDCCTTYEPLSQKAPCPTYGLTIRNGESEVSGLKMRFSDNITFNCPTFQN